MDALVWTVKTKNSDAHNKDVGSGVQIVQSDKITLDFAGRICYTTCLKWSQTSSYGLGGLVRDTRVTEASPPAVAVECGLLGGIATEKLTQWFGVRSSEPLFLYRKDLIYEK